MLGVIAFFVSEEPLSCEEAPDGMGLVAAVSVFERFGSVAETLFMGVGSVGSRLGVFMGSIIPQGV
jgi:hypothetical protein